MASHAQGATLHPGSRDAFSPPLVPERGSGQNSGASATTPGAIFREGKEAMQDGQLTLAEEDFRRVIALDPKSSAAYVNLGVVYMREKHWNDALTALSKAEALSPDEPGIRLNIGLAYYRKSDFAAAIDPFTAVLRQTPD